MIDYHKYVGYCRSDEKREKPVGGAGGRWDEEKSVENKPVENKPVESGGTIQPIRPLGVEIHLIYVLALNSRIPEVTLG